MFRIRSHNCVYLITSLTLSLHESVARFRPRGSCINQLLSINHEILNVFGKGLEVRGIFLDITKVCDKVWHNGLLFKLRQYGASGDILNILEDFLRKE